MSDAMVLRPLASTRTLVRCWVTGALVVAASLVGEGPAGADELVSSEGGLIAVDAARLLDTRVGPSNTTIDGQFEAIGRLATGDTLTLQIADRAGVAGADAVLVNVTAIDPLGDGHLTVYPCDEPRPETSNLNYRSGAVVGNNAFTRIGVDGTVCIYTHAATHLVADVTGYVPGGGTPTAVTPARLLDTRVGLSNVTIDGEFEGIGRRAAGNTLTLQIADRAGVAGADAVLVNVTAIDPLGDGHLTVYPCDEPRPETSNLNYRSGAVVGNNAFTRIGVDGTVCIYTHAPAHLVADITGYVPAGGTPTAVTPARLLDTRTQSYRITSAAYDEPGPLPAGTALPARETIILAVHGRASVPWTAVSVLVNVTAISPLDDGHLTVYPCDGPRPDTSNLNYRSGAVTGNNALSKIGFWWDEPANICIFSLAETHVVVDVTGYTNAPAAGVERAALVALYDATDGPNWTSQDGWLSDDDHCTWAGVNCPGQGIIDYNGAVVGSVFMLGLDVSLRGAVPPEIGDLEHLAVLSLPDNQLTELPAEIGALTNLQWLDLSGNQLTGDITDAMTSLKNDTRWGLYVLRLSGSGCPTISDPEVRAWVEGLDPEWDSGCS